jgi:P-type E1-E2 ATPase
MLSLETVVIRDTRKQTIDAAELVPGDIVLLKSGDKVPADIRLVKSKDLRMEESPLTGESTAIEKQIEPVERVGHHWRPAIYGIFRHCGGVRESHRGCGKNGCRYRNRPHKSDDFIGGKYHHPVVAAD